MSVFTKAFWADARERIAVTAAQAALVVLTLDGIEVIDNANLDEVLYAAGFGGLYALLKAVVASRFGDKESASLDPQLEVLLRR